MLYNEEAVRANIRNREGKRIFYLGKGDQLTSAARDYLSRERIEIRPGEQAKQDCFPLLTGGFLTEKPEHMTHLNGDFLVVKDHPRIIFRGKLDTLESELILCQLTDKGLEAPVGEILELARRIIRCEVLDELVGKKAVFRDGWREDSTYLLYNYRPFSSGLLRPAPLHALGGGRGGHCPAQPRPLRCPGGRAGGGDGLPRPGGKSDPGGYPPGHEPDEQYAVSADDPEARGRRPGKRTVTCGNGRHPQVTPQKG